MKHTKQAPIKATHTQERFHPTQQRVSKENPSGPLNTEVDGNCFPTSAVVLQRSAGLEICFWVGCCNTVWQPVTPYYNRETCWEKNKWVKKEKDAGGGGKGSEKLKGKEVEQECRKVNERLNDVDEGWKERVKEWRVQMEELRKEGWVNMGERERERGGRASSIVSV